MEPAHAQAHSTSNSALSISALAALLLLLLLTLTASDAEADDPYGSGWISEVDVVPGLNLMEWDPQIAPGPNGRLWISMIFEYKVMDDSSGMPVPVSKSGLRVLSSTDGGRSWFEEFAVYNYTESYRHSTIDVASDGTVLVIADRASGLDAFVYADGVMTEMEIATGSNPVYPCLTIDSSDKAYCAFSGFGWSVNQDLYLIIAEFPYTDWSVPKLLVGAYDQYQNVRPSVSCDDAGRLFIAYERSSDGNAGDIYVLSSQEIEPPWTPTPGVALSTDAKDDLQPTTCIFQSDVLMVAWTQEFGQDDFDVRCAISWDHGASFTTYPGFVTNGNERNARLDDHAWAGVGMVNMVLEIDGQPYYVSTNPNSIPHSWSAPKMVSDAGLAPVESGRLAITSYHVEFPHHSGGGWNEYCAVAFLESARNTFYATQHYIIAGAGVSPNATDVNQEVRFSAYSWFGHGTVSYYWSFADGTHANVASPVHVYSAPGTYQVWVTATDSLGYIDYWDAYPVVVNSLPTVTGAVVPLQTDTGLQVSITCSVSGGTAPFSFDWDLGDGGGSTQQNPKHAYAAPGDYQVSVTVTDQAGQHASWTSQSIHVNPWPWLICDQTTKDINIYQEVTFSAQAGNGTAPYSFLWQFGDGETSQLQNVSHIFSKVGLFLPKCTLTDGAGYVLVRELDRIMVHESATLTVLGTPTQGIAPLSVNYACYPEGGIPPYTFEWYFGDGNFSDQQNPEHTYVEPGEYRAIMVLMDSTQATTTTVEGPPILVLAELMAQGNASKVLVDTGQDITFNCGVSGGLAPYSIEWSFGDGETANGATVVHGYSNNGTYQVMATVNDSASRSNVLTLTLPPIQVNGLPLMLCGPDRTEVDVGLNVSFSCTPLHGTPPYSFAWDFGDGNTSSLQEPVHSWEAPGDYTVTFLLGDSVGAEANLTLPPITVNPWPTAWLEDVPETGVAPFLANMNCSVQGGTPPFRYYWDFGDLSGWGEASMSRVFTDPGNYTIMVWVQDECDATVSAGPFNITVMEGLRITDSIVYPTSIDLGQSIAYNCSIEGGLPPYSIHWDLGDGEYSNSSWGSHVFAEVGVYNVSLEVQDASGSKVGPLIAQVTVSPRMSIGVDQSSSGGEVPFAVQFHCNVTGGTAPNSFVWDFGDGFVNSSEDPVHVYRTPGSFSPSLVATDATGASASWSGEEVVSVLPAGLIVDCDVSPLVGYVPLTVRFNASVQGADPSYEFRWDFGDGGQYQAAGGSHIYSAIGNHTVTFELIDPAGPSTVLIWSGGPVRVRATPLTLNATASVTQGPAPLSVLFNCTASGNIAPYAYHWDFGDWNSSEERETLHDYLVPGTYEVRLTVTGTMQGGGNATWSTTIVVSPAMGSGEGTDWVMLIAALVAATLACGAAALWWLRRRPKK